MGPVRPCTQRCGILRLNACTGFKTSPQVIVSMIEQQIESHHGAPEHPQEGHSARWRECIRRLQEEIPEQQINTWIRPLQAVDEGPDLRLLAPNRFVLDRVKEDYLQKIQELLADLSPAGPAHVYLEVGTTRSQPAPERSAPTRSGGKPPERVGHNLNRAYTFDNFVEGKSHQLARAASMQVAANPGKAYNPLFIYGGVGLGKTHLMYAVGNAILDSRPGARVIYLHSERFVADMVKALQHNSMADFKRFYRSVDALLIDDIQFFANKDRSQEEFFHTFNALLEGHHQIILSCDRYPKEVEGLEDRLKSRFGWGLTVAIEPPELETRVAILQRKAPEAGISLPSEVAFFVAKRIRSNVRELEGALRRIMASAEFSRREITLDFTKEALRDLLALQDKLVTLENIQKTVAQYYKLRVSDLLSTRRSRSIARPRQMAMFLAKEFTSHSLPEIGEAFGGRDHTTVLHACRKIKELMEADVRLEEDYKNLVRTLTS